MAHLEFHNHYVDLSTIFYQSHVDLLRNICIEFNAVDKFEELEQKFLDKLKVKAKKDPLKPKKGKTSYMFFCDEMRANDKKNDIKLISISEQSKKFGKAWQALNEDEKQKYIDLAEGDKGRYEDEMKNYAYSNE